MPATNPPTIYLTFDDGPNMAATPQLLDVLKQHAVAATFFVIDRYITNEGARVPVRDHPVGMSEETTRVRVVIVSGS